MRALDKIKAYFIHIREGKYQTFLPCQLLPPSEPIVTGLGAVLQVEVEETSKSLGLHEEG